MPIRYARRGFLIRGGIAAASVLGLPALVPARNVSANERLRLGIAGHIYNAGHFFDSGHLYPDIEIVALCDPDRCKPVEVLKAWKARASREPADSQAGRFYRHLVERPPQVFSDVRAMYDQMLDRIDAVMGSLYDHMHGVLCGPAMRAGKHVFNERPLGLTINEARRLRELASQQNVATSIRNPGNASGEFRRAVELIQDGAIGKVQEVHAWFPRGGVDRRAPPKGSQPVPEGLDWNAWLGPLRWRDYHPDWMAYNHWRESANGGLGSFGTHVLNLAFAALDIRSLWTGDSPSGAARTIRVEAETSGLNRLSFPRWEIIRWHVPARRDLPPVTFHWYHGPEKNLPGRVCEFVIGKLQALGVPDDAVQGMKVGPEALFAGAGVLILGSDAAILSNSHNTNCLLLPQEKFSGVQTMQPERLPRSPGHYREWLDACRGGPAPWANFQYAGPLSEFIMIGSLSTQFEKPLEYDPVAGRFIDNVEANRLLGYQYREGWTL